MSASLAAGTKKQRLRRNRAVWKGYALIPRMACPPVDILQELMVDCLQMGCIEGARDAKV